MKRSNSAFSLVEVMVSLGIMAFSLVAVLGVFPIGLRESLASIDETRSAHLARKVFATLDSGSFESVPFFGNTVDLGAPVPSGVAFDPKQPLVILYAAFLEEEQPVITIDRGPSSTYEIKVWCQPIFSNFASAHLVSGSSAAVASKVALSVMSLGSKDVTRYESIIGNY
jgi:hypothetical protein